ncbi:MULTISPECIES: signal peptidase I [Methanothermobacter]|jgi:signal peptidase|uniref:Signal peptidase n=3 Tax=Methanothermobacter TaxID=145260 RepID=O27497_METTH|nr:MULTISPECIES: signal peptidase I [Methanothermobacter]MBC7110983.1 signal peptidase I [Methanothermobacter sp.]AAB85923.1 signal peptidase [Methanothermobacter thermautotrophicus str. Delta H]MDK2874236.1 signal peptidase [Methanothermobacter sp.]MDN5373427.1 signal peptidase [Methanothermobacter sp.]NLU03837.1 signal peptidase I [Methanothermobacter sp.]
MNDRREVIEAAAYLLLLVLAVVASQHMNVVVSGSMEPVFYRGDIVIIEKTSFFGVQEMDPESIRKGDIIIYDATWFPEPVIHRVIGVETDRNGARYYITKGDNNQDPDPAPVYPSQVEARVLTVGSQPLMIPRVGYITLWLKGL